MLKNPAALLIEKVQGRSVLLSVCIAEALSIAKESGDRELIEFCQRELLGFNQSTDLMRREEKLKYRLIEVFQSLTPINPNFVGWGGSSSAMFQYMEENPKEYTKITMFYGRPISTLETEARVPNDGSERYFGSYQIPASKLVKDMDVEGIMVYCYFRPHAYANLLESIRRELVKNLMPLVMAGSRNSDNTNSPSPLELIDELERAVQDIPVRGSEQLRRWQDEVRMAISRIFGEGSHYHREFDQVDFYPARGIVYTDDAPYLQAWSFGIKRSRELFSCMRKDVGLFKKDDSIQNRTAALRKTGNNPWISGSFYLFVILCIVVIVRVAFGPLQPMWIPVVFVGGILCTAVIGALQLRNDDRLKEKGFLELMFKTLEYIPLIRSVIPRKENKDR
jgi:hypothetical protein